MGNDKQVWLRSAGAMVAAGALVFGMTGCNGCSSNTPAPITNAANGTDPADANLATVDGSQPTQVMGQSAAYTPQQSGESYAPKQQTYGSGQQAPAPIVNGNGSRNEAYNYNTQANGYYDSGQQGDDQGSNGSDAYTYAQTDQAPPELPVYEQPPAPDPDDIWTPGYWGYANTGYYWTPGAWVAAPFVGALWTPGYWGYDGGHYRFRHGFWGRHIGYYGGINYGHGYIGSGYYGGYWNRDHFYYNNAVTRVSPRITNVYERNVVVNNVRYTAVSSNRVSFNGGHGGVDYRARPYEVAAMHEQHVGPVPAQQQFHREAAMNRANFYSDNHGRPAQLTLAQPVRTERIAAPSEVNRGGFGRGPLNNAGTPNGGAVHGLNEDDKQRLQLEQQRNAQLQQHNHADQQRGLVQQQQNAKEQQRNQQLQQHNQAEQQRGLLQQQHNMQLQQSNHALEQQRAAQVQHNPIEQQHGGIAAQGNQQELQHNMRNLQRNRSVQPQQPRAIQEPSQPVAQQPRFQAPPQQHIEQPRIQQPQHAEQPRFQPQPQQQQRIEQPRPQFTAQPHVEQHQMQRPAPQQHIEAPRAAPAAAPHMEAPHAGPPAGGGGHPGGGGHH